MKNGNGRTMTKAQRERIRATVQRTGSIAAAAKRLRMSPDRVAHAARAAAMVRFNAPRFAEPRLDAGALVRALVRPVGGIALSLDDLAEQVAEWCRPRGWSPTSLGTLKLWSAAQAPPRTRPGRFRAGRPSPGTLGVLAAFAEARGVGLEPFALKGTP